MGSLIGGGRTLMATCLDPRDGNSFSDLSGTGAEEEEEEEEEKEEEGARALHETVCIFISTAT